MTTVVGLADKNGVYIGADSGVQVSTVQYVVDNPKILVYDGLILAGAGNLSVIQLIKHNYSWLSVASKRHNYETDLDFLISALAGSLRNMLATENSDMQGEHGLCQLLIAYNHRLYYMAEDYAILEPASGMAAIGSGCEYALGALYASKGKNSQARIETALEAAANYDVYTRGPFTIKAQRKSAAETDKPIDEAHTAKFVSWVYEPGASPAILPPAPTQPEGSDGTSTS
jgi:ATP-dependent protease HslVU (ClpYQ) peptidase subunit